VFSNHWRCVTSAVFILNFGIGIFLVIAACTLFILPLRKSQHAMWADWIYSTWWVGFSRFFVLFGAINGLINLSQWWDFRGRLGRLGGWTREPTENFYIKEKRVNKGIYQSKIRERCMIPEYCATKALVYEPVRTKSKWATLCLGSWVFQSSVSQKHHRWGLKPIQNSNVLGYIYICNLHGRIHKPRHTYMGRARRRSPDFH
jgi:hypothetical protein